MRWISATASTNIVPSYRAINDNIPTPVLRSLAHILHDVFGKIVISGWRARCATSNHTHGLDTIGTRSEDLWGPYY